MPENEKLKPVRKKKGIDLLTKRIVNLIFINLFLIFSGILWLDYIGIINIREDVYPKLAKVPVLNNLVPKRSEDPYLLSREEHRKEEIAKQIEWEKIKKYEESLKEKEIALKGKEKSLAEYENRLKLKEKELDEKYKEKETYQEKIAQQAKYFVSMRPEEAVKRLELLDDLLLIDILKEIERQAKEEGKISIVPYYLSLMKPERAAQIQRKMTTVEIDTSETNY